MRSAPGEYHGFLWFYFINEQLLRFLNLRYPRDYNTVPRLYFWLFHLVWLFPWSVYFPAVAQAFVQARSIAPGGRACWRSAGPGFVLVFFTFSTTQEYYSMPCYPALALLLGSAMAAGGGGSDAARASVRQSARAPPLPPSHPGLRCATLPRPAISRGRCRQHPGRLYAVAGPHGGPHAAIVRLPAAAARRGGSGAS